jgi:hypothetical protein
MNQAATSSRSRAAEADALDTSGSYFAVEYGSPHTGKAKGIGDLYELRFSLADAPMLNRFVCQWMFVHP